MKCLNPITIKSTLKGAPKNATMQVDCKKCVNCLALKRQKWTYRLECEQRYNRSLFVSLDYAPEHQLFYDYKMYNLIKDSDFYTQKQKEKLLKLSNKDVWCRGRDILTCPANELPIYHDFVQTVSTEEMQNFFKRLRKNMPELKDSMKYYCIGEYGGEFHRNHYHFACFLKSDIDELKFEQAVMKSWQFGQCRFDMLCDQLINYITKYMTKNDTETPTNPNSLPCFSINSNNLGKRGFLKDYYYLDSTGLFPKYRDLKFRTNNGAIVPIPSHWRKRYIDETPMDFDTYDFYDKQKMDRNAKEFENFCRTYFPSCEPTSSFVVSSYLQATDARRKAEIANSQSRFKHSAK